MAAEVGYPKRVYMGWRDVQRPLGTPVEGQVTHGLF